MWKRFIFVVFSFFVLTIAACSVAGGTPLSEEGEWDPTAVPATTIPTNTVTATIVRIQPPSPSVTATPSPNPPTVTPIPSEEPVPPLDLSLTAENVYLYPVPHIFSGDLVTFQLMPHVPPALSPDKVPVHISINGTELTGGTLSGRTLGGTVTGLFEWVWNTSGVLGEQTIEVVLDPDDTIQDGDENPNNNRVILTVTVHDPGDLPATEANATWVTAENDCCYVHAVTGTAAYRDLPDLLVTVDAAIQQAATKLNEQPAEKLNIYFIDRVIGQGGYARAAVVISYLDRDYTGNGLYQVLVHEAIHVIDRQFAPQRIPFLSEGVAVWGSEGHYKPEDLHQRSAALVETGYYIPLADLINDFYPIQHEIGYLQAAGFVSYLVEKQGWPTFRAFYSDVTQDDIPTLAEAVDLQLQIYYGKTLAEVESEWLAFLAEYPLDKTAVIDLETTIRYYDVMRHYQLLYDPTAHFLTAWLPHPGEVRANGNPADLTRHPQNELNIAIEVMLQATDTAIRNRDYDRASVLLDSVTRVLNHDGSFVDPLAISYLNIVRAMSDMGYEAQQVTLTGDRAEVLATPLNVPATLRQLNLILDGQDWVLSG